MDLLLQWRTNKKSYTVYRTAPFLMTLNDPKVIISRSGHSLMLNISEMAKDVTIVTMEGE